MLDSTLFQDSFLSIIIVLLIIYLVYYVLASGIFQRIEVRSGSPVFGTIYIAYKYHVGCYSNVGNDISRINSIKKSTKDHPLVGIYYDNPKEVERDSRRYMLGIVLSDHNMNIDEEMENDFKAAGYQVLCISQINNAVKFFKYYSFELYLYEI